MSGRILFYVQHLLGIGHLKRAEILAQAMSAAGLDVTVAMGGAPVAGISFAGAKVAMLPAASIAEGDFSTLRDAAGQPVDDAWRAARRDSLLELLRRTDPDVVLLELFPFGRRQFRFELLPLLETAHRMQPRPRVACSVRDILVGSKGQARAAETAALVNARFDLVLVHGDPALIPFSATFDRAAEIAARLRYTGYVCALPDGDPVADAAGRGEVLVSAGGGAVGAPILFAAEAARPLTALAGATWRFLAGPNLPDDDYARLAARTDDRTIVERFRPDFGARLECCAVSISQAGYNTTMDVLRAGARAVMVPFQTASETEQRLRADLLADRGMLTVVGAAELSAASLADGIAAALARPKPDSGGIDLSGAGATAALLVGLAEGRQRQMDRVDA